MHGRREIIEKQFPRACSGGFAYIQNSSNQVLKESMFLLRNLCAAVMVIGSTVTMQPRVNLKRAAALYNVVNAVELAPLVTLIDQFLNNETANEHTTRAYTQALDHFLAFLVVELKQNPKTISIAQTSRALIQKFCTRQVESYSPSTVALWLRTLKAFFGWAAARYHIEDPSLKIREPEVADKGFKGIDEAAYRKLIQAAKLQRDPLYRFVPLLLVWSGLRNDEACSLTMGQVSPDMRWLHRVTGKSAKMRNVPIVPDLASELATYLEHRDGARGSDPLLVSNRGTAPSNKTLWRIVNDVGNTHPHALRHTFAYRTMARLENEGRKQGEAARILMRVMGHTSFQTTLVYLGIGDEEVASAFFGEGIRA